MANDNVEVLGKSPKSSVVELYNRSNQLNVRDSDVILSTEALEEEQAEGTLTGRRRQHVFDQPDVTGSVNINWRRLNLGFFFGGINLEIPIPLPATTLQLLDELERRTGLKIDSSDVVLEQITLADSINYKLKARPESLRWYGEVTVDCSPFVSLPSRIPPGSNLGSLGEQLDPEGWVIELGGQLNGNLNVGVWNEVEVGTVLLESVAQASLIKAFQDTLIAPKTLTRWQHTQQVVANNLYGAVVTYNDVAPEHMPKPMNESLTHAIRLFLSPFYCTSPAGIVTIYYDPNFIPGRE